MINPKPKRGGARKGAGRKPQDGVQSVKARLVMLDDATVNKAQLAGSGNISEGIRRCVAAIPEIK